MGKYTNNERVAKTLFIGNVLYFHQIDETVSSNMLNSLHVVAIP